MKTTKRTTGALAFLATFIMVLSVMAPLADAGAADNSAPVLFSDSNSESNSGSKILLGTGTNADGITVDYYKGVYENGNTRYVLTVTIPDSILKDFDTAVDWSLSGYTIAPSNIGNFKDGAINLALSKALTSGIHTLRISGTSQGTTETYTVTLNLNSSIQVTEGGYDESSEIVKDEINAVWNGEDIEDIDDKTMYLIYEQIGTFTNNVTGGLYLNDELIYSETLKNQEGQRIWYFSFSEGAPAKISDKYAAGTYTLKIVGDENTVAETTVTVDEQPEQPSLKIIDQGYGRTQNEASNQIYAACGKLIDDVISNTMWVMFNQTGEFTTLKGELYFEDGTEPAYLEPLTNSCDASKSGNKLWYFSFDDQASTVTLTPGVYTLKIVGDENTVAETTVTIDDPKFKITIDCVDGGSAYGTQYLHANDVGVIVATPEKGKIAIVESDDNASITLVSENVWTISNLLDDVTVKVTFVDKPVSNDFRLDIITVGGTDEYEGKSGFNASLISNDENPLPDGTLRITYVFSFIDNDRYTVDIGHSEPIETAGLESVALLEIPSLPDGSLLVSGCAEFCDIDGQLIKKTETILV